MKALTILQPYPTLIMLPSTDPRHKRVENRNHARFAKHRGTLLIHAGLNKRMLDDGLWGFEVDRFNFGAIVGAVDMVSHFMRGGHVRRDSDLWFHPAVIAESEIRGRPWLATHQHVEGPYCLVFENIRRFREPIHCKGAQGLWHVPVEIEQQVKEQLEHAEALL